MTHTFPAQLTARFVESVFSSITGLTLAAICTTQLTAWTIGAIRHAGVGGVRSWLTDDMLSKRGAEQLLRRIPPGHAVHSSGLPPDWAEYRPISHGSHVVSFTYSPDSQGTVGAGEGCLVRLGAGDGSGVGKGIGWGVGCGVGTGEGCGLGKGVGCFVGSDVGCRVGKDVGCTVGKDVGCAVGKDVGCGVGRGVGWGVGRDVGGGLGTGVGWDVGRDVGDREWEGNGVGNGDGIEVGTDEGSGVGSGVGGGVGGGVGSGVLRVGAAVGA